MKTYIVRVSHPKVRGLLVSKFEKVGSPRAIHKTILVTTSKPKSVIERIPGVERVMEEVQIDFEEVQESPPNWALPTICDKDDIYEYRKTGKNVDIFIVDTGIRSDHIEFQDSAGNSRVTTLFAMDSIDYDPDQPTNPRHGTVCASQAAGNTCGVAKEANIFNLKVYNALGTSIIKGLDIVLDYHLTKQNDNPSILNMSFGTTEDLSYLEEETLDLIEAGVICVSAAGNNKKEQSTAPACHSYVLSVGAIDIEKNIASFSNYGETVDIFAPGVLNTGADIDSSIEYSSSCSGTSYAGPLVAGVLALIAEGKQIQNQTDVERITSMLLNGSKERANTPDGTTSRLVYSLTPTGFSTVFLDPDETSYNIATSGMNIYGQQGFESITLYPSVVGVFIDGNVEEVFFHYSISDYTFKQRGNGLLVYKDKLLVAKISVQSSGINLVFDSTYFVTIENGVMTFNGVPIEEM